MQNPESERHTAESDHDFTKTHVHLFEDWTNTDIVVSDIGLRVVLERA